MSTTTEKTPVTFYAPCEQMERLIAVAEENHVSVSFCLNDMLDKYLSDLESAYQVKKEAQDIRDGKVATRPLGEVLAELGV